MPSIRKTKKRLKRRLKSATAALVITQGMPADWSNLFIGDALTYDIKLIKQELQQLKRKKV